MDGNCPKWLLTYITNHCHFFATVKKNFTYKNHGYSKIGLRLS